MTLYGSIEVDFKAAEMLKLLAEVNKKPDVKLKSPMQKFVELGKDMSMAAQKLAAASEKVANSKMGTNTANIEAALRVAIQTHEELQERIERSLDHHHDH